MKRLLLAVGLGCAALLSGCEDPAPAQVETAAPPVEAVAPVEPPPAVVEAPPSASTPSDYNAIPPDARQSEETVKPESETLFY